MAVKGTFLIKEYIPIHEWDFIFSSGLTLLKRFFIKRLEKRGGINFNVVHPLEYPPHKFLINTIMHSQLVITINFSDLL